MMYQDVIQEILLHLDLKLLVRCTCLSEKWYAFISNNQFFRSSYISRNRGGDGNADGDHQLLLGFFSCKRLSYVREETAEFVPTSSEGRSLSTVRKRKRKRKRYDKNDDDDNYLTDVAFPIDEPLSFLDHQVVHCLISSNGLLLASVEREWPIHYWIFNPINKQQIVLPTPSLKSQRFAHGLASHAALKHYKVVRAPLSFGLDYATAVTLEIFSSDLPGQWRQIKATCPFPFQLDWFSPRIVINKSVTYLAAFVLEQTTAKQCVLVCDESKEDAILQVVEMPPREDIRHRPDFFGMSDGQILYGRYELDQLKTWLLSDDQASNGNKRGWSPKHKINLESKVENYNECVKYADDEYSALIAFHPGNSQVFFFGFGTKRYQYNVNNSRFELIYDFDFEDQKHHRHYFFLPYTYPLIGPHLFHDL